MDASTRLFSIDYGEDEDMAKERHEMKLPQDLLFEDLLVLIFVLQL